MMVHLGPHHIFVMMIKYHHHDGTYCNVDTDGNMLMVNNEHKPVWFLFTVIVFSEDVRITEVFWSSSILIKLYISQVQALHSKCK